MGARGEGEKEEKEEEEREEDSLALFSTFLTPNV